MRRTSAEETLQEKEAYKRLAATHGARVCNYRADNRSFTDSLFKDAVQTCRQHISYCGVGYRHQNEIVKHRIKEFTLGSWTLLLHTTRLWLEVVITMMWSFSFKSVCMRYNSL